MSEDYRAGLQQLLNDGIPLTNAMRLAIREVTPNVLHITAPLESNRNVHGTAFAGSLYALGMLTAWTLITHFLRLRNLDAVMVQKSGQIDYRRPVRSSIECHCEIPQQSFDAFHHALTTNGKGQLEAAVSITDDGEISAILRALFVARLK